jgi:hypothetical protein
MTRGAAYVRRGKNRGIKDQPFSSRQTRQGVDKQEDASDHLESRSLMTDNEGINLRQGDAQPTCVTRERGVERNPGYRVAQHGEAVQAKSFTMRPNVYLSRRRDTRLFDTRVSMHAGFQQQRQEKDPPHGRAFTPYPPARAWTTTKITCSLQRVATAPLSAAHKVRWRPSV